MNICRCQDSNELFDDLLEELRGLTDENSRLSVFLPTGRTPKPLYERMRAEAQFWSKKLDVFQIDDYFGEEISGMFKKELQTELIGPLKLNDHFHTVAEDFRMFDEHAKKVIAAPPRVAVLGLGQNGHVGFHEPGLALPFTHGRVPLSPKTKTQLIDYNKKIGNPTFSAHKPVFGHTFGADTFINCEVIFMIVTGANKKDIFEEFMNGAEHPDLPATLLKSHPEFYVFVDDEALGENG